MHSSNIIRSTMKPIEKSLLGHMLNKTNRLLIKSLNRRFTKHNLDLTRDQFVVLNALWHNPTTNQQSIADRLDKDKYSITKLIDGLEKRNLVKRVPSLTDRRLKNIELMPKANTIKSEVEAVTEQTIDLALKDISDQDLETCFKVLSQILENVKVHE